MKDYRKKNSAIYLFMLVSTIVLGLVISLISFITGRFPFPAIPGFMLVLFVTLSLYHSLLYVSLTNESIIIRNATRCRKDISYQILDVDAVRFEHSFVNGYSIGIKRGYITDIYKLSLVGKREVSLLKGALSAYGVKIN